MDQDKPRPQQVQQPELEQRKTEKTELQHQRLELLQRLEQWLETPTLVLAFVWLALLMRELVWGQSPLFDTLGTVIWVIFLFNFTLEFWIAPHKLDYLKRNWLSAISVLLPALRLFRIVRVVRSLQLASAARGLRLVRVIGSLNRGMRALEASLSRRGFGYVVALTLLVTLVGAAGMYTFEQSPGQAGLNSYASALWWTAMIMTTMGSEFWPRTGEGRVLGFFLALYAFAVFGYVTATLATFFIGRDADKDEAKSLTELKAELSALREEIAHWRNSR